MEYAMMARAELAWIDHPNCLRTWSAEFETSASLPLYCYNGRHSRARCRILDIVAWLGWYVGTKTPGLN